METETFVHQAPEAEIRAKFNAGATGYDQQRRLLIPCFDDFYHTAARLASIERPAPRVLDLGAGTGIFSAMLLARCPDARITLVDLADEMLVQARERFRENPDVDCISANYGDENCAIFDETYDVIISALSIHHLDHAGKQRLFGRVYQSLAPGGRFVNADQALGDGPITESVCWNDWRDQVESSGLTRAQLDASYERRKLDRTARLVDQLNWMKAAGFREVDCPYRFFTFAVFVGIR